MADDSGADIRQPLNYVASMSRQPFPPRVTLIVLEPAAIWTEIGCCLNIDLVVIELRRQPLDKDFTLFRKADYVVHAKLDIVEHRLERTIVRNDDDRRETDIPFALSDARQDRLEHFIAELMVNDDKPDERSGVRNGSGFRPLDQSEPAQLRETCQKTHLIGVSADHNRFARRKSICHSTVIPGRKSA